MIINKIMAIAGIIFGMAMILGIAPHGAQLVLNELGWPMWVASLYGFAGITIGIIIFLTSAREMVQ